MDVNALIEKRMQHIEAQREALLQDPLIEKYVNACDKYVQEHNNRKMTVHERRNIAQCLWNAIDEGGLRSRGKGLLNETTTEDAISFLGVQLPVIAALLPSLALNEVAVVQALDRRIAAVFYFDMLAASDKGSVSDGDTLLSATTGHPEGKSPRRYAMARVVDESIGTGNDNHTGTVAYAPGLINLENVKVQTYDGTTRTTLGTADSSGNITGDYISGTGSINASGVYDITTTGISSSATVYLTYDYQYDLPTDTYGNEDGVPKAKFQITQSTVEAIDFPIRSEWSVGAAIDVQKAHGINLESEVVKYLGSEISDLVSVLQ